jgi:hypothetical protein
VFQIRHKDIRMTLNNKTRDVFNSDRFLWCQAFKDFKNVGIDAGKEVGLEVYVAVSSAKWRTKS